MPRTRRTYTPEFKAEAVRLVTEQGYSVAEAARSLGISENLIRNWRRSLEAQGDQSFPGRGKLSPFEEENRRLRAENKRLLAERDTLNEASPTMDEPEADYLRQQIQELRQATARWQALALIALSVPALLILAGGATLLTGGLLMAQRMREEAMRARDAEMEARMQAEREARMRADEAARQAREAGKAAEPCKR
jgi:transposase